MPKPYPTYARSSAMRCDANRKPASGISWDNSSLLSAIRTRLRKPTAASYA